MRRRARVFFLAFALLAAVALVVVIEGAGSDRDPPGSPPIGTGSPSAISSVDASEPDPGGERPLDVAPRETDQPTPSETKVEGAGVARPGTSSDEARQRHAHQVQLDIYDTNPSVIAGGLYSASREAVKDHRERVLELLRHPDARVRSAAASAARHFHDDAFVRDQIFEAYVREETPRGDFMTEGLLVKMSILRYWRAGWVGEEKDPGWERSTEFLARIYESETDDPMRWVILAHYASLSRSTFPPPAVQNLRHMTARGLPEGEPFPGTNPVTADEIRERIERILEERER